MNLVDKPSRLTFAVSYTTRDLNLGTDIQRAIQCLTNGELVAIPTETVYGLAANAFNPQAVTAIYKAKDRPQFNPLIIHTHSIEQLEKWGLFVPEKMKQLAVHFSPGPLTYVIPKSETIPDIVTAGTNAVAVRIPNHPLTLELLRSIDFPLAAPSANPSGFVSPTNAWHVNEQLGDKVEYILNGGDCSVGVESTIISFLEETPSILRYGGLAIEDIEKVIGKVTLPAQGFIDNPVAPGQLARHYATNHKLIVGDPRKYLNDYAPERIGVIAFSSVYTEIPTNNQFVLSTNRNLDEAAQQLFAAMRNIDTLEIDVIIAETFPDKGLGRAINDRLKRASVTE
ncbi:MAG: L-threonylcarbamoyladenylate synthase [Bacteroidota bacterium]